MSKRSHTKQLISRLIVFLIVSIVIGCSIYFANAQNVFGSSLPMPFGIGVSVVLSGSMEPALSKDDLVIIAKKDTYAVGDIVVYESENVLVIHRIVSIQDDKVITKGDANNTPDDPITLADIKGKMVGKIAKVGAVVCYIQQSLWIKIVLILLAVLLLILSYRKERTQKDKSQTQKIKDEIALLKEQLGKHAVEDDVACCEHDANANVGTCATCAQQGDVCNQEPCEQDCDKKNQVDAQEPLL